MIPMQLVAIDQAGTNPKQHGEWAVPVCVGQYPMANLRYSALKNSLAYS
jgi:hypothetical protein